MPFRLGRLRGAAAVVIGSTVGRLLALCLVVVALLSLSALWEPLGIWPATIAVLVTILLAPAYGVALDIFLAVFQQFAYLGPVDFHLLHGIVWSAAAVRLAVMVRRRDLHHIIRSPTTIMLILFACLASFHNALPPHSPYYWLDVGFVCSLTVIVAAVAIPDLLPQYLPRLIVFAIFAGALLSIGFDAVYEYAPLPGLSPLTTHLPLPAYYLRLAGLHTNPLATGKFILVPCCLLAVSLIWPDQHHTHFKSIVTWALFAIVALALVATESKSTILAFLLSLLVMTFIASRVEMLMLKSLVSAVTVSLLFLAIIVLWSVVIAPPLKHYGATAWLEAVNLSRTDVHELAESPPGASLIIGRSEAPAKPADVASTPANSHSQAQVSTSAQPSAGSHSEPGSSASEPDSSRLPPADAGPLNRLLSEFRVGKSVRIQAPIRDLDNPLSTLVEGEETGIARNCGVFCTGQRDLLWKAGLETIKKHWLIGIGFGGWKKVLGDELGFPFDHPHLGLIEVWGEFGMLGLAMYLTLIAFLVKRARDAISTKVGGFGKWFLVGSSMAALAFLANELFDATKFFSMSPHAIWIWSLLALQERFLQKPATRTILARLVSCVLGRFKSLPTAAAIARRGS